MRWLLAVAKAGETALERGATAIGGIAAAFIARRGTGKGRSSCTCHCSRNAGNDTATAKQRPAQRLPHGLRTEHCELDGQKEGDALQIMVVYAPLGRPVTAL
jgi:hypothetical protein